MSRIFYGEYLTTTDSGFCCEPLRQFCGGESFTVIALRQLRMAFSANDRLTTMDSGSCCESLRQLCRKFFTVNALQQLEVAFAANLSGSSVANLLRLMPYSNWQWLLLGIFAAVLSRIFYSDCLTTTGSGFCCEFVFIDFFRLFD